MANGRRYTKDPAAPTHYDPLKGVTLNYSNNGVLACLHPEISRSTSFGQHSPTAAKPGPQMPVHPLRLSRVSPVQLTARQPSIGGFVQRKATTAREYWW